VQVRQLPLQTQQVVLSILCKRKIR
jgi:hypothetical protein